METGSDAILHLVKSSSAELHSTHPFAVTSVTAWLKMTESTKTGSSIRGTWLSANMGWRKVEEIHYLLNVYNKWLCCGYFEEFLNNFSFMRSYLCQYFQEEDNICWRLAWNSFGMQHKGLMSLSELQFSVLFYDNH